MERGRAGGTFETATEIESFLLRPDCEHQGGECVELVPGGTLYPPAWGAGGQCDSCPSCESIREGTYRVVMTSCGGAHRIESEPFTFGQH
jgi:hypothetical protein